MSNSFKLCPTHFSRGREKFSGEPSLPCAPPYLRACLKLVFRFAGFLNLASVRSFPYLLQYYFHYCLSFRGCHQALKNEIVTKQFCTAQRYVQGSASKKPSRIRVCDYWSVLTRKRDKGTAVLLRWNSIVHPNRWVWVKIRNLNPEAQRNVKHCLVT